MKMGQVKSQVVGEFNVVLVDLGFGYQVRTYFVDGALYDTQLSKPSLELGLHNFDFVCAAMKAQQRC